MNLAIVLVILISILIGVIGGIYLRECLNYFKRGEPP